MHKDVKVGKLFLVSCLCSIFLFFVSCGSKLSKFNKYLESQFPIHDVEYYYVTPDYGYAWIITNKTNEGVRFTIYSKTGVSWNNRKLTSRNIEMVNVNTLSNEVQASLQNFNIVLWEEDQTSTGLNMNIDSLENYKVTKTVFELSVKDWGFTI